MTANNVFESANYLSTKDEADRLSRASFIRQMSAAGSGMSEPGDLRTDALDDAPAKREMHAPANPGRGLRNPIIADSTAETLLQVGCCLNFIGRVHADLADWEAIAETSDIGGPGSMSWEQHRGLSLLTDCVRAAVMYELERVG